MVRAPTRSPQVWSWSAAAARKVSAAPRTTDLPSATRTRASLPVVVVLPVPLTPTTMTTPGTSAGLSVFTVRSRSGPRRVISSSRSRSRSSSGVWVPSTLTRSRSRSTSSWWGDADVGGEEGLLDLLPGVLVEVLAGQEREQPLAERVLGAGEAGPEPYETAGGGLGDLDHGAGGSATTGSSTAVGVPVASSAVGSSTSSTVRRGSSRGVSASSPTRGSAGGAVMVGGVDGGSAGAASSCGR